MTGVGTQPLDVDVDAYVERIGLAAGANLETPNLETLAALQLAHLQTVPFENLDIVLGAGVRLDAATAVDKIVNQGRGGWCFEVNAAFAALLETLGYRVIKLGAAVLLDGPTTVIEHLALEVHLDQPYLVDVGFGESFITPLALNSADPQFDGAAHYQFIPSPQGTTLTRLDDDVPVPQYRFKRVAHQLEDFAAVSASMQTDPDKTWHTKPFATRLLNPTGDRVTLGANTLKFTRADEIDKQPVHPEDWDATLTEWFSMTPNWS